MNFIPAEDELKFRVLLPSPAVACELLEWAVGRGYADSLVFKGRKQETTVAHLLEAVARSEESQRIETALAATRTQLMDGLGLQEEQFIPLPALFQQGLAVIPNPVNSLVCNKHVIVPDPAGPSVEGDDIFASFIRNALEGLETRSILWISGNLTTSLLARSTVGRMLSADCRRQCSPGWWHGPVRSCRLAARVRQVFFL